VPTSTARHTTAQPLPDLATRINAEVARQALYEVDDSGDAAYLALRQNRQGWDVLSTALEHGPESVPELPAAVTEMLATSIEPPAWVDLEQVDRGAVAWWRFGTLQMLTLLQSLIYGYQAPGLVQPLAMTGRLSQDTSRRLGETARWVHAATAPGALHPFQEGWRETVRLRLVHCAVRHMLAKRPDWDHEALGPPINQAYSSAVAFAGFLVIPVNVARDLGARYSARDLADLTHQWRWIAWLLGVPEHLHPQSFEEAEHLLAEMTKLGREQLDMRPDDTGREMTQALLEGTLRVDQLLPRPFSSLAAPVVRTSVKSVLGSVSTRWMDPEVATGLGLRQTPLHRLVDLARPAVQLREVLRSTGIFGTDEQIARRERALMQRSLDFDRSIRTVRPESYA
jgi:hypothetical protein